MSDARRSAERAREATAALSTMSGKTKHTALKAMASALRSSSAKILAANAKDVARAKSAGLAPALVARLALDTKKIGKMADSIDLIAKLPDPVGRVIRAWKRPNGLAMRKIGVPIGSILIIYESRPNVTADCMALCLKSGNAVILKGGSEALDSNRAIHQVMADAAAKKGVPRGAFELVATADRSAVSELLGMSDLIDLVIPRGGEGLIRRVAEASKIPVIKHYKGVCHVYVDAKADLKKSEEVVLNAKAQNPAVCNAIETLLVHESVAPKFLPLVGRSLAAKGVELRADERARKYLHGAKAASEEDWYAEYLDLILAVRVVKNLEEAIGHIERYGSHHTDAIMTRDAKAARRFESAVSSACVFVNCSTRFNDGGEFGMGAEMGISTDKLHARGPMGLEELTTYKYVVRGNGQIRK